jgi:hypothetical protein
MKKVHLFTGQYSNKFHQEIPILLELFLLTMILVCATAPFSNTLYLNLLAAERVPASYYKLDTTSSVPMRRETLQRLLPDARIGRIILTSTILHGSDREILTDIILYDAFLLETVPMPIKNGAWITQDNAGTLVPIIIGGALREEAAIGATIQIPNIFFDKDMANHNAQYLLDCIVIAHLPDRGVYLGDTAYGTTDMTNDLLSFSAPNTSLVLMPLHGDALPEENLIYHVLSDTPLTGESSPYAAALADSGLNTRVFSRDRLCGLAFEQMITIYSLWFLLAAIAVVFLVMSVFIYILLQLMAKADTYLVYYRCGMNQAMALGLSILPILLPMLVMSGLGILCGVATRASLFYVTGSVSAYEALLPLLPLGVAFLPAILYASHFMKTRLYRSIG